MPVNICRVTVMTNPSRMARDQALRCSLGMAGTICLLSAAQSRAAHALYVIAFDPDLQGFQRRKAGMQTEPDSARFVGPQAGDPGVPYGDDIDQVRVFQQGVVAGDHLVGKGHRHAASPFAAF